MIRRTIRPAGLIASGSDVQRAPNGVDVRNLPGAKGWTPTVANLLVLVVLEIVAFGVIRYVFRRLSD
jgi:hypothetical protein